MNIQPPITALLCLALVATLASPLAQAGAREKMLAFTSGLKGLDGRFEQQVFEEGAVGNVGVSELDL